MKNIKFFCLRVLIMLCFAVTFSMTGCATLTPQEQQTEVWRQIHEDAKALNDRIIANAPAILTANTIAAESAAILTGNPEVIPLIKGTNAILQGLIPTLQVMHEARRAAERERKTAEVPRE